MAVPTEFSGFVRDVARRALDTLAERVKDLDPAFRPVLRAWNKLTDLDKEQLLDELISSVRGGVTEKKPASRKRPAKKKKA